MNNEQNTQAAVGAAPAAEAAVAPPTGWREVLDRMRTDNRTYAGQERAGMLIDSIEDALGELEGAAPVAAQAGQVAVPEGWAFAPLKPTKEMLAAAMLTWANTPGAAIEETYTAMLAAAPSPAKESK